MSKPIIRYNNELLKKYFLENNINSTTDYSDVNLSCKYIIKEKCLDCDVLCEKTFRSFINTGCYCKKHINKTKIIIQYTYELLQKYFLENNINSTTDYSKVNLTCEYRIKEKCLDCDVLCEKTFRSFINTGCYCKKHMTQIRITKAKATNIIKYGFECSLQSKKIQDKIKATNLEKYGVEYASQSEEVKDKMKATNLERLGVEYPGQSQEVKIKMKATNLEKYGFENPFQSEEIKDKMKATNLERRGVEHPLQSQEVRDKCKATNLERFGVENPSQSEDIKDKKKVTCLKNHGVEHPAQNAEISEKMSKNAYKGYDFVFPSGRIERIQGYEKYMLNDLLFKENVKENDIIVSRNEVPIIWYEDATGKKHRYFVDCFIKTQNRCIEVKSTWTAENNQHNIYLKQQAVKDACYLCEIWIYDSKGEIVEKIL